MSDRSFSDQLREAVGANLPGVQNKGDPDQNDLAEERALGIRQKRAAIEGLREDNRNKQANRALRWKYATWVFVYLICYSLFAAAMLLLHGFQLFGFVLPDVALGALIGSTAVSAIGLVASVVTGLFKSDTGTR
jgi:polyferredoxin